MNAAQNLTWLVQEVLPKRATLYIPDLTIAADVARSGVIDFQNRNDRTEFTNRFTFWINDDCDSGNDDTASDLDPSAATNQVNSANGTINGLRDLEDFARLQFKIDGLPAQFLANYQVKAYLTNLTGNASLRLFPAADSNGGLGYLEAGCFALCSQNGRTARDIRIDRSDPISHLAM